jgi:hypothetical protein
MLAVDGSEKEGIAILQLGRRWNSLRRSFESRRSSAARLRGRAHLLYGFAASVRKALHSRAMMGLQ